MTALNIAAQGVLHDIMMIMLTGLAYQIFREILFVGTPILGGLYALRLIKNRNGHA